MRSTLANLISSRQHAKQRSRRIPLGLLVIGTMGLLSLSAPSKAEDSASKSSPTVAQSKKDEKVDYKAITDAEWRKRLTRIQFSVTRKHDTEKAFTGKYHDYKKDGVYTCVCCSQPLFDSTTKFDSGTGWPSFYQPLAEDNIGKAIDRKLAYTRVEVHCSRCDAHLGHVFNDAPQTPTGLRYCMNSAALNFLDRAQAKQLEESDSDSTATVVETSDSEPAAADTQAAKE